MQTYLTPTERLVLEKAQRIAESAMLRVPHRTMDDADTHATFAGIASDIRLVLVCEQQGWERAEAEPPPF